VVSLWIDDWTLAATVCILSPLALLQTKIANKCTIRILFALVRCAARSALGKKLRKLDKPSDGAHWTDDLLREQLVKTASVMYWLITVFFAIPLEIFGLAINAIATGSVFLLRFCVNVWCLFAHPVQTCSAIPGNWLRHLFCVDCCSGIEAIPGLVRWKRKSFTATYFMPMGYIKYVIARRPDAVPKRIILGRELALASNLVFTLLGVFGFCIFFAPAFLLRFSIKSSALVYWPLIWELGPIDRRYPLVVRASDLRYGVTSKYSVVASWLTIVSFVMKLALFVNFHRLEEFWVSNGLASLDWWIVPRSIPGWQLVSFIVAILVLWRYEICCFIERRNDLGYLDASRANRSLTVSSYLIRLGQAYIIPINLFLIISQSQNWEAIKIGPWFPSP
jgi:hypothetical protein